MNKLIFLLLSATAIACHDNDIKYADITMSHGCIDNSPEQIDASRDFEIKCIEAGGKGPRSTEDWVEECHTSASKQLTNNCRKGLIANVFTSPNWNYIPCESVFSGPIYNACVANGWVSNK